MANQSNTPGLPTKSQPRQVVVISQNVLRHYLALQAERCLALRNLRSKAA